MIDTGDIYDFHGEAPAGESICRALNEKGVTVSMEVVRWPEVGPAMTREEAKEIHARVRRFMEKHRPDLLKRMNRKSAQSSIGGFSSESVLLRDGEGNSVFEAVGAVMKGIGGKVVVSGDLR